MLKVMIVDDEPVIRFGIKASIDWEKEGFSVIGDFANGAEALERMKEKSVDILITDIKMPVMDGLTLSREALKLNPRIKIVLVSSYNDFEFVRQGLKLGAVDYILKHTLEPEELLVVVQKCAQMIYEESRLQSKLEGVLDSELISRRKKIEQELKHFLIHPGEVLRPGSYPEWLNGKYLGVYVIMNRVRFLEETYGYLYASIMQEQLIEACYKLVPRGIALPAAENELFLVMPDPENAENRLHRLKKELETEVNVALTFGYKASSGIEAFSSCFFHSKEACGKGFFEGEGVYPYTKEQDVRREGGHLPSMMKGIPFISADQFRAAVLRWKADWTKGGIPPFELKEQAGRALSMLFKDTTDPFTLVETFDRLFKSETLEELCEHLIEQFDELKRHNAERIYVAADLNPVDKAVAYIRQHYLEPISLQQVADQAHVSKNYFSILFKKTMGKNFIDYIIDLRILKAKELLGKTDLKIYEVAEQSGFNDVKYFSKLFKKMTGLSPVDYREYHRLNRTGSSEGKSGQ